MPNVLDYVKWRGDLSLEQSEFNSIDSLVLSCVSYISFDGIVENSFKKITIYEAAEKYFSSSDKENLPLPGFFKKNIELLDLISKSNRYKNMCFYKYVNKMDIPEQKQFAALTISIDDNTNYISFRGTDDSFVGWKEDFTMSFITPVPSHLEAVTYLNDISSNFSGNFILGGHSKGGNLSVYAASFCSKSTRNRIISVYNYDGPGYDSVILESEGYKDVKDRVITFFPKSSIIGMLLEHDEKHYIIDSEQSGIFQHDPYSWQVSCNDFIKLDSLTNSSLFINLSVKQWLSKIDDNQREQFIESLFEVFETTNAQTFTELSSEWLKNIIVILQSLKNADETTKDMIFQTISQLMSCVKDNIPTVIPKIKSLNIFSSDKKPENSQSNEG